MIGPRRRIGSRIGPASSGSRRSRRCRRLRFTGPEIAEVFGMSLSTVSGILARIGMGKLGRVGLEPAVRYERERPGELIHIDIKKLGRIERGAGARITGMANRGSRPRRTDALGVSRQIAGWEYVHIAIDDCTRLAYAEVLPDQRTAHRHRVSHRAVAFYARYGITVQRLLTDNGGAYRSTIHADRLPHPRDPPPTHPRLPTPDQRQGRAVHPHPHRRLGLRSDLPHQRRTHRRP